MLHAENISTSIKDVRKEKRTFIFNSSNATKLPQMKQNKSLVTRLIISSLSVFVAGWLLPGVQIDSFTSAIGIALVLGLLNSTLKPLLILVTIPITIFSLGLFLLIINAIIIGIADQWLDGLHVKSTWTAILFSFLISTISSWMYRWGNAR